jgi:hypothetical protein
MTRTAAGRRTRSATLAVAIVAAAVVVLAEIERPFTRADRQQTTWAKPGAPPLSDTAAAALVVHRPETEPQNRPFNFYMPTEAQLSAFHDARTADGELADRVIPERRYVTGRPGLRDPSTDDLIQWAAYKWGVPVDWIRAQMAVESSWNQRAAGDQVTVTPAWRSSYPPQARIPGYADVYESMGISQVKWRPDGSVGPGTEPLRWESTAFALDFYAAEIRYFYDGRCSWCGPGYGPGQSWNSIGAWYEPTPWDNSGQRSYVTRVQQALAGRLWEPRAS